MSLAGWLQNVQRSIRLLRFGCLISTTLLIFLPGPVLAYLDLAEARVNTLDNGLTLIVLEDHTLPVVSVQMLYRVGARNETTGATGLAHFLEHMAFRSAKNFPDTGLVSSIYAVGGEWHGYTWLDQTTYFATVPRQELDLLLRIEADRMTRLDIPEDDVLAERGAILAEMHGYENDPMSVLQDNVMYLVFLGHPYRNNTIGWESDVAQLSHSAVVNFYQQHYHPGNAVLAVVGDVLADQVKQQVQRLFGALAGQDATPAPHTVEPRQSGVRRIRLQGDLERKYFKIAYRAPAANSPDFAAFLLTQELLAGGSGVSFLQNDRGSPVRANAPLSGVTDDLGTWFPPSAQDYVFTIGGSVSTNQDEDEIERLIESRILDLRSRLGTNDNRMKSELELAKQRALRELMFDVRTTEDAAHQLAFFTGLDALHVLFELPQLLAQVGVADIERVLRHYLGGEQRTIGWYAPSTVQDSEGVVTDWPIEQATTQDADRTRQKVGRNTQNVSELLVAPAPPASSPVLPNTAVGDMVVSLDNGTPVILKQSALSATVNLTVLTHAAVFPPETPASQNKPMWGVTSLDFELLPDELEGAILTASSALESARTAPAPAVGSDNPADLMELYFQDLLGLKRVYEEPPATPILLVVCGDFDPARVLAQLEEGFGGLDQVVLRTPEAIEFGQAMDIESILEHAQAQEQLGYLVQAPGPGETDVAAWQMALYILSHGYEGRLGKQAISRRGLLYYIDSNYGSDGLNGWITLSMGIDPDKLPAMKKLLREELRRLLLEPPSQQEVDEARQHLLGRHISAAQSNPELANELARQWFWFGHPLSYADMEQRLFAVQRQDIIDLLPVFTNGSTISIRNPRPDQTPDKEAMR